MTPAELKKIAENSGWSDPTRLTVINLIELWDAADQVMGKYSDLMDTESNLYWGNLYKALEKLKETK